MKYLATFAVTFTLLSPSAALGESNNKEQKELTIAIVEALKPNTTANWTDFARQEYEAGLKIGEAICNSLDTKIEIARHYFAGHSDVSIADFNSNLRRDTSDLFIIPGNSANALAVADALVTRRTMSPFTQSPAIEERLPKLAVPVPSIDTIANFVVRESEKNSWVVALYDPTVENTLKNAESAQRAAQRQKRKAILYPIAAKERNHTVAFVKFLRSQGWDPSNGISMITSIDTRLVVPFLTSLSGSAELGPKHRKLFGLASFPPQFKQQISEIKNVEVFDVRVTSDVRENEVWTPRPVSAKAKEINVLIKTELSAAVAEVLWLACSAKTEEIRDWKSFQNRVEQYANSKTLSLLRFDSNTE